MTVRPTATASQIAGLQPSADQPIKRVRRDAGPGLPRPHVYLAALILLAAMTAGLEVYWRSRGCSPNVPDSTDLWCYHWSRVGGDDPKLVVAIGTSRIRTALRPEVLRDSLPGYRFIQLGINGPSNSLGLLAEISRIPRFRGLVLCDLLPPTMDPEQGEAQVALAHRPITRVQALDTYLRALVCDRFAVLNSSVALRKCLTLHNESDEKDDPLRLRVHADRALDVGYSSRETMQTQRDVRLRDYAGRYHSARRYKNISEFKQTVGPVAQSVARIRKNGGQVIFLRLPSSGARHELEESEFSSKLYFDALATATSAPWFGPTELSHDGDLDCPDESHLSPNAARLLTTRLFEALRLRGLLPQ
jgi:hypothetical protein